MEPVWRLKNEPANEGAARMAAAEQTIPGDPATAGRDHPADRGRSGLVPDRYIANEDPQPQVVVAPGLRMTN